MSVLNRGCVEPWVLNRRCELACLVLNRCFRLGNCMHSCLCLAVYDGAVVCVCVCFVSVVGIVAVFCM